MVWDQKKLIGLPVKTEDGQLLGKIKTFEVDIDKSEIAKYIITNSNFVKKILKEDLIIDKNQVIEITEAAMIVDSSITKNCEMAEATG